MKRFISYLLSFCLSISMVFCVSEAGAVFLLISPGAAAQGLGEAQVASANDAYTSYFNPAGLSFINGDEVVLQHCNWLPNLASDIYFDFIGFNKHIGSGTLGGHLIYLNLGAQDQTNTEGLILGQFRSYMTALTLGYSTTLNPNSSIGFNFKVYHQRLADSAVGNEGGAGGSDEGASTDLAFDLGYLLKFGKSKQHNFGLAIQNIGPPIDFVDAEQADPAPTNMKLGFDFLLHSTENTKISVLFDMNKLLVASYQAMDWDGDGYIDGSNADPNINTDENEEIFETKDWSHKDEWYDGVINAWLDDWYYGGDYDKSRPSGLAVNGMLSHMWYEDGEDGELYDTFADGRIGGFTEEKWKHVMIDEFGDSESIFTLDNEGEECENPNVPEDCNSNYGNLDKNLTWFNESSNATASESLVYAPNYSGFCEETYRSLTGINSDSGAEYGDASYGSMCYDIKGQQYDPSKDFDQNVVDLGYGDVNDNDILDDGEVGHYWIDMPNDGFGSVDVFDAHCDPESNYDCTSTTVSGIAWNTGGAEGEGLAGFVDIGDPSAVPEEGIDYSSHDGDGICEAGEDNCISVDHGGKLTNEMALGSYTNVTRMDIRYDRDGRGEYAFNESEYGEHNPYGYREKGSGDDRSFQDELEEVVYNFGVAYNYTDNFTLRAGFIYDLEGDVKNPTVGAGLKFNNYGFDFGYTSGKKDHPRANTMFFSLSIGIGA